MLSMFSGDGISRPSIQSSRSVRSCCRSCSTLPSIWMNSNVSPRLSNMIRGNPRGLHVKAGSFESAGSSTAGTRGSALRVGICVRYFASPSGVMGGLSGPKGTPPPPTPYQKPERLRGSKSVAAAQFSELFSSFDSIQRYTHKTSQMGSRRIFEQLTVRRSSMTPCLR